MRIVKALLSLALVTDVALGSSWGKAGKRLIYAVATIKLKTDHCYPRG
jgi:hypothetical protein